MTNDDVVYRSPAPGQVKHCRLPGIGERFDLGAATGGIAVIIHHSGRHDLYLMGGGDTPTVARLSDAQAFRLGMILAGAHSAGSGSDT